MRMSSSSRSQATRYPPGADLTPVRRVSSSSGTRMRDQENFGVYGPGTPLGTYPPMDLGTSSDDESNGDDGKRYQSVNIE